MLSVGQILSQERIKQGYQLDQVEKAIKIRKKYLVALENDDWIVFSSKIYIIGIIQNYARFLGIESKKILAFFRREYERKEEVKFKKKVSSQYLVSDTRRIIIALIAIVFLTFFGYFGYQLVTFLSPPKITIIEPKESSFKRKESIKIVGRVDKEVVVTILGNRVYQNKDGVFEYVYPLKVGVNELVIEALGANGKKTIIKNKYTRLK